MVIRQASKYDTYAIAELALMACDGIPAYFWAQSQRPGERAIDVGARKASSERENFSYRNVQVAEVEGVIAGMLLAYRLPSVEAAEDPSRYPDFIRPLIELEQHVPDSYYLNMQASYPKYRNLGIGSALMRGVDDLARRAGCNLSSVEVFEENCGALRFYQRLGYHVVEKRQLMEHHSHLYQGRVLLLVREVEGVNNYAAWSGAPIGSHPML